MTNSLKSVAVNKENYTPEARKHRGLFKSILGFVNADVNGARNIIKKFKSSPKSVQIYGQIGIARCGDHLLGIRFN